MSFDTDFDLDLSGAFGEPKKIQPPGKIRKLLRRIDNTNDFILAIDWSTFSTYLECPTKAEYTMIYSRNDGGSAALAYGRAIHKGLEEIYLARALARDIDWSNIMRHAQNEYIGFDFGNDWRTPEKAFDVLTKYSTSYANEPFDVLKLSGEPVVEKPFSYTLCEIPVNKTLVHTTSRLVFDEENNHEPLYIGKIFVNWTGVIDLVMQSLDGQLWPTDHKTTSVAGPAFYRSFALSGQFIGYCAAVQHILGISPAGMLGNFIVGRKPSVKGKGVSLEFNRELYKYESWQLGKWVFDIVLHAEKFVFDLVNNQFPSNHTSCQTKYGLCKYFATCSAAPEHRLQHLMSDAYVNNVWNPLD